jgi:regulation of enolase protein 1 (concanavalin A-like superfamily)
VTAVKWDSASWHSRPKVSAVESDCVRMVASAGTDFWRVTEGIAPRHDGNAVGFNLAGDFRFQMCAKGSPESQFDQFGLIAVESEERWLKVGLELDGEVWLSAVHTNGESDWSREFYGDTTVTLALTRENDTVTACVLVGGRWRAFRVLTLPGSLFVGAYTCAPRGAGFPSEFCQASIVGNASRI